MRQLKYNHLITLIRLFVLVDCLLVYAFIQVFLNVEVLNMFLFPNFIRIN